MTHRFPGLAMSTALALILVGSVDATGQASSGGEAARSLRLVLLQGPGGLADIVRVNPTTGLQGAVVARDVLTSGIVAAHDRSMIVFRSGSLYDVNGVDVMNVDGTGRRSIATAPEGMTFRDFAWSPDGLAIVASLLPGDASALGDERLWVLDPAGAREPVALGGTEGLRDPVFDPRDSSMFLAKEEYGEDVHRVTLTATPVVSVVEPPWGSILPVFSPDGTRVAYPASDGRTTVWASDGSGTPSFVETGGSSLVGWSADGTSLLLIADGYSTGLVVVDVRPGATFGDGAEYSYGRSVIDVADGLEAAKPFAVSLTIALDGAHPLVAWSTSQTAARAVVRRGEDAFPGSITDGVGVYDGAETSVVDNVAILTTYYYSVFVDTGQGTWARAERRMQALAAPAMSALTLGSGSSAATTGVSVWWGHRDNPVTTRYRTEVARRSGVGATWTTGPFVPGVEVVGPTGPINGTGNALQGTTWIVRAQSMDAYGNVSRPVEGTVVVPVNETIGTYSSGWTKVSDTKHWASSYRVTKSPGASATFTLRGSQLFVVGDKCATCGRFSVTVDGAKVGTFSSYSATTKRRTLLWTGTAATAGKHTVTVKRVTTSGRPYVKLDAVAGAG